MRVRHHAIAALTFGCLALVWAPTSQDAQAANVDPCALAIPGESWPSLLWQLPPQRGAETYRSATIDLHFTTGRASDYIARVQDAAQAVSYWYVVRGNALVKSIGARPESSLTRDMARFIGPGKRYARVDAWTSRSAAGYMATLSECRTWVVPGKGARTPT